MRDPNVRQRLSRLLAARLDREAYLGLHLTIGVVVAVLGTWAFAGLLDAVLDDATMVRWDQTVDAWLHAHVAPVGFGVANVVTQLGSPAWVAIMMVVGAVLLWRQGRRTELLGWIAAFVGGIAVDQAVKLLVHRARPTFGIAYLHGPMHSYSFPSGHAMGSTIGYGMVAFLLRRHWAPAQRWRWTVVVLAVLLVLAIGVSRIVLGVHYPSDVLGGYAAGLVWLAACLTGIDVATRRRDARVH